MAYQHVVGKRVHRFDDLKTLMACATPQRSGDVLAGIAADSAEQRVAARWALADLPLRRF
jgi:ethanolamine ammonia-lyase large subunit